MLIKRQNQYLYYLVDPSFQGVNRLFALPFECEAQRISYKRFYLPIVEIKNYNVMIDGQSSFDNPAGNNLVTYGSIQKIETFQWDDYTIVCFLNYNYFKNNYKVIAANLSKP